MGHGKASGEDAGAPGGLGACWAATPLAPATRNPPLPSMPLKEAQDVEAMLVTAARRGNQGGELDPLVLRLPAKFADLAAKVQVGLTVLCRSCHL